MSAAPCGCAQQRRAEQEPDLDVKQTILQLAEESKRCWSCPNASKGPASTELPSDAQESLVAIERLTGASRAAFKTCPLFYLEDTAETGAALQQAIRAREFFNKGQLQLIEGDKPSLALIEAIEAIEQSVKSRTNYELTKSKEEFEKEQERRKRANSS